MICLKDINLSEIEEKKQKVIRIREELKKEEDELRRMLVARNIEYYGTSPSKYFKGIDKKYETPDGYFVTIKAGRINITKRLQANLTMSWSENFNENTSFSVCRSAFKYDSNRCINSSITKCDIAEKHEDKIRRFHEIIEEEKIYNPFSDYSAFYGFTDFFDVNNSSEC